MNVLTPDNDTQMMNGKAKSQALLVNKFTKAPLTQKAARLIYRRPSGARLKMEFQNYKRQSKEIIALNAYTSITRADSPKKEFSPKPSTTISQPAMSTDVSKLMRVTQRLKPGLQQYKV